MNPTEDKLKTRTDFHPNGQKALEGQYLLVLHGVWRRWAPTGMLLEELELVRGVRHGRHVVYAVTGVLVSEGTWSEGRQHGVWRTWRADGVLLTETEYADGVVLRAECMFK